MNRRHWVIFRPKLILFLNMVLLPFCAYPQLTPLDSKIFFCSPQVAVSNGNLDYAFAEGFIHVYERTGQHPSELINRIPITEQFTQVNFLGDTLLAGSSDGAIHMFNLDDPVNPSDVGCLPVDALRFHLFDSLLVVTNEDLGIYVYDARSIPEMNELYHFRTLQGETNLVNIRFNDAVIVPPYLLASRAKDFYDEGELIYTIDSLYVFQMTGDELVETFRGLFRGGKIQLSGRYLIPGTQGARLYQVDESGSVLFVDDVPGLKSNWLSRDSMVFGLLVQGESVTIQQYVINETGYELVRQIPNHNQLISIVGESESGSHLFAFGEYFGRLVLDELTGVMSGFEPVVQVDPRPPSLHAFETNLFLYEAIYLPRVMTVTDGILEGPYPYTQGSWTFGEGYGFDGNYIFGASSIRGGSVYRYDNYQFYFSWEDLDLDWGTATIGDGRGWTNDHTELISFPLSDPEDRVVNDIGIRPSSLAWYDSLLVVTSLRDLNIYRPTEENEPEFFSSADIVPLSDLRAYPEYNLLVLYYLYGGIFQFVDMTNPANPDTLTQFDVNSSLSGFTVVEGRLLVTGNVDHHVNIYSLDTLANPVLLESVDMGIPVRGVTSVDQYLVISYGAQISTFDLSPLLNVNEELLTQPTSFSLAAPYPNPFNASVTLPFYLPASGRVSVQVFNILGQEVWGHQLGTLPTGWHHAVWDSELSSVGSGIYFLKMETEAGTQMKRLVLLK